MTNEQFFENISHELEEFRKDAYNKGYEDAQKEKAFDNIGMKDVCFSLSKELPEDDERLEIYKKQRIERGYDDTELWNLDSTILKFILPRLKEFKENAGGYPCDFKNFDEWMECVQKMIVSIESIINDDNSDYEGWELFKTYFFDLWI